ncbi:MAG: primosomal protein N' [Candidatus Melainabacteria bacterium]|nr:primosomal protein N' [Candidatus Melainabacteria bacterium]
MKSTLYSPKDTKFSRWNWKLLSPLYAEIVIDLQARDLQDRLFTYRVPEFLLDEVFVGAQVLVPFGHQETVGGYVVGLKSECNSDFKLKDIAEVLEPDPLFDKDYIDFLGWLAFKSCARLSDVVQAAIPASLAPRIKRVVRLTKRVEPEELTKIKFALVEKDPSSAAMIKVLSEAGVRGLSVMTLRQRFSRAVKKGQGNFFRALTFLKHEGVVEIVAESTAKTSAKTVTTVIRGQSEPKTARQKEITALLERHNGNMNLSELLKSASTTYSTIHKLEADGVVQLMDTEIMRNPMDGYACEGKIGRAPKPQLTKDQEHVVTILMMELQQKLAQTDLASRNVSTGPSSKLIAVQDRRDENDDVGALGQTQENGKHAIATAETLPANEKTSDQSSSIVTELSAVPDLDTDDEDNQPWLLFGVTGSGKTEVYLRLIEETLNQNRTALLLVPEISLTPQLASRLKGRFGDMVSIWHSAISPGERYDTWRRLRSGSVKVLLGARSAILANVPNLGLIILDEEHDGSYKQSTPSPRYNAKEVAIEKARRHGALVLLGSATPDIGTYHNARKNGTILELPNRVHSQPMPEVKVIDMRQELYLGNRSILSGLLSHAIEKRLDQGEQIILLMNRRGYASHVFCRACGYVAECKNCSVSLVYHKTNRVTAAPSSNQQSNSQAAINQVINTANPQPSPKLAAIAPGKPAGIAQSNGYLACHHCGYERHNMLTCPSCQSPFIKEYGLGTQQVEETIRSKFPEARTLRLDSDVTRKKGAYREIFEDFANGEADVLIGTQMVAKGLDIANVTLVGVLVADAALNMPDYRSTERGFQLLSQVSGRAGRGLKPGQVILQTYNPDLQVIEWAKRHDYSSFFESELAAREAFDYPPYSRIIRLVLQGPDPREVEVGLESLAEEMSLFLEDKIAEHSLKILGPAPCIIERVKNRFRFHLLLKVKGDHTVMDPILQFLRNKKVPKQLSLAVDVDALDLL